MAIGIEPHRVSHGEKILLTGCFDGVEVVGDPGLDEPVVNGPHLARRLGHMHLVEGRAGFPPTRGTVIGGGGSSALVIQIHPGTVGPVVVRVPPRFGVSADLDAETLTVRDVTGPIRARLRSGSVRVENLDGELDLAIQAGSAQVAGRPAGVCQVVCESGTVDLALPPDADLRLRAACRVGTLSWGRTRPKAAGGGWTLGNGTHELTIGVSIGSIRLNLGSAWPPPARRG